MSIENDIQNKIIEVIKSVNKSIPIECSEIFINIEMSEDGGGVYFDFKSSKDDKFYYSLMIGGQFKVDEIQLERLFDIQFELGYDLWKIFKDNHLPTWESVVISVIGDRMSTTFDYTPWSKYNYGPTDRRNFFKYKYLGFKPRSDKEAQNFKEMEEFQKKYNN